MSDRVFEYLVEAREAYQWYLERDSEVAERFWQQLRHARNLATERPTAWPPYLHGTRCYRLHRFPYGLVYIECGEVTVGLAVAHLKRRPGYWKDRLESDDE